MLKLSGGDLNRLDDVRRRYRQLHTDPDHCSPMIIIDVPVPGLPTFEQRLADPLVMLQAELAKAQPHLQCCDDYIPDVRVQFGTGLVAAAFGCQLEAPTDSFPAVATHILQQAQDVETLPIPSVEAGWFAKLKQWIELWRHHLPPGIGIVLPDIQSPFNNAHLIRGNDIFLDIYDCPERVTQLMDKITDYMIALTCHLRSFIGGDREWFVDFGSLFRGAARLSNCSLHMVGPEFYHDHIRSRDQRFFDAVGGGRIHYCGTSPRVFNEFWSLRGLHALDFFARHHDLFDICRIAPRDVTLCVWDDVHSPMVQRLLQGQWPAKRNLIIGVTVQSLEQGREVLATLRQNARRNEVLP